MKTAIVIPVGPGREENVLSVLESIGQMTRHPVLIVLVCDGPDAHLEVENSAYPIPIAVVNAEQKHVPGLEQPRNLGVKVLQDFSSMADPGGLLHGITHAWFLDTDVIVAPDALEAYEDAMAQEPIDRVLIGPYDWMPPGQREPMPELHNDPRWDLFNAHQPFEMSRGELNFGLACFSGNLVWPIAEFARVGGFWNEMHHGRAEDGELGVRAVAMGVPISVVAEARGWHIDHPRNMAWIMETNAIDVPKLNERHPWIEGEGLFVVEEDGKRFNVRCPNCSQEFNSGDIWRHERECKRPVEDQVAPTDWVDKG